MKFLKDLLRTDCDCGPVAWLRKPLWGLLMILGHPMGKTFWMGERLALAEGHLTARIFRADGRIEDYDLGHNTITDAGVQYMVDDFDNGAGGADISNFNFHAWGTGSCSTPPTCGTTTLATEASEARVAGTRSQPSANVYRTVATITADANKTITEWGLFSASSGGTAWSLRCFTGLALLTGDSIQFTYSLTISCVTG